MSPIEVHLRGYFSMGQEGELNTCSGNLGFVTLDIHKYEPLGLSALRGLDQAFSPQRRRSRRGGIED